MTLLECYPNRGARMLEKVLKSAMSNAEDLRAQLTTLQNKAVTAKKFRLWKGKNRNDA